MPYKSLLAKIMVVIVLMGVSHLGFSQNEDCIDFEVICSSSQFTNTPTGSGSNDFSNTNNDEGCLSIEHESAWYYFEFGSDTPSGSIVTFVITPDIFDNDYDFALYGPNVTCDNLGSPLRCSYSAADGSTGLSVGAGDDTEGAGGDAYVNAITVNPGDGFYLLVDNYSNNTTGFNMTWGGDGSDYLNCDPLCELTVELDATVDVCEEAVFTINSTITDASGSETYIWTATGGQVAYLNDPTSPNPEITLPPGFSGSFDYTLTVTDGTCEESASITVSTLAPPVPNSGNESICSGVMLHWMLEQDFLPMHGQQERGRKR